MKKKFVKVALLSVLTCGMPAMFTSCDDDGWKDRTNTLDVEVAENSELITKLTEQTKALDTQIAQYKQQGETAQKSADAAMTAAENAQKAGDDAMAAAKAADAAAQLAAVAAAEAKAEAAENLKKQYEELIAVINANANEIAANKALIEGNKALIEQYKGLIDGNTVKINDNAGAIANILKSLESYATTANLEESIKNLSGELSESLKNTADDLNKKLEAMGLDATNGINGLSARLDESVAGIQVAINALNGQAEALGLKISGLEEAMNSQLGELSSNLTAQIQAEAKLRADGDAALQGQIDALKKQIDNLNLATNLSQFTQFIADAKTQLEALEKYDKKLTNDLGTLANRVTAAEDLIKKNQDQIKALNDKLTATSTLAKANAGLIERQALLIAANSESIGKINTSITDIKNDIKTLTEGTIADLQGYVGALDAQMSVMDEKIDQILNELNDVTPYIITMTMDQLRGLVFIPESFVGGIESALSYNMTYRPFTAISNTAKTVTYNLGSKKYVVADYPTWNVSIKPNAKDVEINPVTEISYHMNPTSAKVEFKDLHIVSNDAEIISRSSKAGIDFDKTYNDNKGLKIEDGVLTVAITGDTRAYSQQSRPIIMPVFALQADVYTEDKDGGDPVVTKVTSDYAMFSQMNITPQAISIYPEGYLAELGAAQGRNNPPSPTVANSASAALSASAVAKVAWNGSIDLTKIFQIDYYDSQRRENGTWVNEAEWGKFDLKFDYQLINYTIDNNKVSESAWATIDENGVLTPHVAGEKADVQSQDELGHMPLVFVTVKHGDDIVLKCFVKVLIAPTEDYYVSKPAIFSAINFNCNDVENYENAQLSGNLVEHMCAATGLSLEVFGLHYTPYVIDETDPEKYMRQFSRDADAFMELTGKNMIGDIAFDGIQADDIVQNFRWELTVEDKQKIYEKKDHTATVYVCFVSDDENVFPDLYIPVTGSINPKAEAKVESKMEARWFRNQTTALLNVPQPTNSMFVETISTDLNLLWQGSKPKFRWDAGMPNPINEATYETQNGAAGGYRYYFPAVQQNIAAGNGTPAVTFTVAKNTNPCLIGGNYSNANMGDHALLYDPAGNAEYNNNQIFANGKLLAEINPNTGVITLADSPEAKALLNAFQSDGDGLNRTNAKLQVQVGIVAYNECGIALKLNENSTIPSTFLRPINIVTTNKKNLDFTDATANGSKVDVFDLLDFSDWRGESFTGANRWLFAYYNVKSVSINTAKIKSNAGTIDSNPNNFVVDASVNAAFSLEGQGSTGFVAGDVNANNNSSIENRVKNAFGKIVYDNKLLNIQKFEVIIPMTIEYELGKFDVEVRCVVNATK